MTFKNKKQISAAEYQTIKTPITTDKHGEVITSSLLDIAVTHDSRLIHKYRPEILLKVQKFLNELINREINSSKINESSKTTVNLEKLIEMYDKGLLTDEEFIAMKKKIN